MLRSETRSRFSGRADGSDDRRIEFFLSRAGMARELGAGANREDVEWGQGGGRLLTKKVAHAARAVSPHVGLEWLRAFSDFDGDDCLIFPFRTAASPRGRVTYNFRQMEATRAMCLMAHGSPPRGKGWALHRCGNGHLGCVNPRHLYWGDQAANSRDAAHHRAHGRVADVSLG